ncbi:MAG: ABC transporter ATP-binding protein [Dethiobacteria bacterium]
MFSKAIVTEQLSRHFGNLQALDRLTLEVPAGMIFGFLGPNGAGKTTTIRLLLGLLEPTSGSASVLGYDIQTQSGSIREQVGVLLEHDGLYTRLSAYDNLNYFGEIYQLPPGERRLRIHRLLKHLELWDYRYKQAGTFSKGMRQKLALARALLHQPALLFLDEPTSGLDAVSAIALREDLLDLARQGGVTVFLTTHNLAEAEKICDRVAVIHRGRLVTEGKPAEIAEQVNQPCLEIAGSGFTQEMVAALRKLPLVEKVTPTDKGLHIYLKEQDSNAELIRLLVNYGAKIEEVRFKRTNLEEAFVSLMKEKKV